MIANPSVLVAYLRLASRLMNSKMISRLLSRLMSSLITTKACLPSGM